MPQPTRGNEWSEDMVEGERWEGWHDSRLRLDRDWVEMSAVLDTLNHETVRQGELRDD